MIREVIQSIFGTYTPVPLGVRADGSFIYGVASVDFEFIGGILLFGIMLWCLLRILGGMLK